jgi:hypothetical protein
LKKKGVAEKRGEKKTLLSPYFQYPKFLTSLCFSGTLSIRSLLFFFFSFFIDYLPVSYQERLK